MHEVLTRTGNQIMQVSVTNLYFSSFFDPKMRRISFIAVCKTFVALWLNLCLRICEFAKCINKYIRKYTADDHFADIKQSIDNLNLIS